jgi:hypothetical protein
MIPRRIVFRALVDVLRQHSRQLRSRTRGASQSALEGRTREAYYLEGAATEIESWIKDPTRYQGEGVDPADFGDLIALIYGHQESWEPLSDLGADRHDLLDIIRRLTND